MYMNNDKVLVVKATYTAFSELFGINGRCEVQPPRVVGHGILPVHKAFRCLSDASTWK